MNNKKITIIHPEDETTDFLEEISSYLAENTNVDVNILRLCTKEDHFSFFETVYTFDDNELILFLGHGTSTGLSGGNTKEYQQIEFITEKQLKVFKNKSVILLSCRSDQYLGAYFKDCCLKSAIGFPNLITDFEERDHHDYPERLDGLTKEDIEDFKQAIVETVKFSLEDYINNELSVLQLYNRLKLRIHKRIITHYQQNMSNAKSPLGAMLHDMVNDLSYFNNYIN